MNTPIGSVRKLTNIGIGFLTDVVIQIEDGKGVVLVKMWAGRSYGQHRLVDKP